MLLCRAEQTPRNPDHSIHLLVLASLSLSERGVTSHLTSMAPLTLLGKSIQ